MLLSGDISARLGPNVITIDSYEHQDWTQDYTGDSGGFTFETTAANGLPTDGSVYVVHNTSSPNLDKTSGVMPEKGFVHRLDMVPIIADAAEKCRMFWSIGEAAGSDYQWYIRAEDNDFELRDEVGGVIADPNAAFTSGSLHTIEWEWHTDGTHVFALLDNTGSEIASATGSDNTHGDGYFNLAQNCTGGNELHFDWFRKEEL